MVVASGPGGVRAFAAGLDADGGLAGFTHLDLQFCLQVQYIVEWLFMPSRNEPELLGLEAYRSAVTESGHALRQSYDGRPIELAERFHLMLPEKPAKIMVDLGVITEAEAIERFGAVIPGLRDLVVEICLGEIESAAVVGPRGGGKSQGVSFIEFYLVFIKLFDALNLGGSELQADQVYQYLLGYIQSDTYWKSLVRGDPMRERTFTTDDAWIRVLTASSKSVRSPHAGGRKPGGRLAGGILVIDEEAEADASIVSAALPTINTAVPSVNIRSSTFHNAAGSFADLIDGHEEMGYKLYKWDVFDVCAGCQCPPDPSGAGLCMSEESCFREDHVETYFDPETQQNETKVLHKAYCGGRSRYSKGWVPYAEILKLWLRLKRNHATWEVEQMGSRPTSRGYVIESRTKFRENIIREPAHTLFVPGCPTWLNVDWGTGNCGIQVWQHQMDDKHVLVECELLEESGPTETTARLVSYWNKYIDTMVELRGDLGGGGNYMNKQMTEQYGMIAVDVAFSEDKEAATRVWNILNEAGKIVIPDEFELFIEQVLKWRRINGRIAKGNDHLADTGICYFSRLIDAMDLNHIRVGPKVFNSGLQQPENPHLGHTLMGSKATRSPEHARVPVVRAFGRGRGR